MSFSLKFDDFSQVDPKYTKIKVFEQWIFLDSVWPMSAEMDLKFTGVLNQGKVC